jgi:class 3 adenylate cyclase
MEPESKLVAITVVDALGVDAIRRLHGELRATLLYRKWLERAQLYVNQSGGFFVKAVTDGALAAFDRTEDAVRFATAYLESLRQLPIGDELASLHAGIAIHTGMATRVHREYGPDLVGPEVGVAAHLADRGPAEGVLLSDSAYETLPALWKKRFPEREVIALRGSSGSVAVWSSPTPQLALR